MQNFDHNIGFWKNAIFSPNIVKTAENCDHNIDPWKIRQRPFKTKFGKFVIMNEN
jgi:hypothetical protein